MASWVPPGAMDGEKSLGGVGRWERRRCERMEPDDLLILAQRACSEGWEGQTSHPPARGTRTIRMCSFDARNRGSTRLPLKRQGEKLKKARSGRSISPHP